MSLASLIPASEEFCVLRTQIVDNLLACRDGDSALLYLYLVRQGKAFDERAALRDLNLTRDRYDRAVHTLTSLHLATKPTETAQKASEKPAVPPRYTAAELRARREGDHRFASVCQTAELVLGRTLTEAQLRTLMNAYANLGLPADVLIDLLTYLKRKNKIVTSNDIKREAYLWADMGIFTAEAAAEFLARKEDEKPLLDRMLQALDMSGVEPTPDVYRYLTSLIHLGFEADAVALAKERTYERIGTFSWRYMKGILDKWNEKGLYTVSEILAAEPSQKKNSSGTAPRSESNSSPRKPRAFDNLASTWEKDWLEEFNALSKHQKEDST